MRSSIFFVTVNTNRYLKEYYTRDLAQVTLEDSVKQLQNESEFRSVLISLNKNIEDVNFTLNELEYTFEEGSKKKRFHMHFAWELVHDGHIRIDIPALREHFLKELRALFGWETLHIDVNAVSNRRRTLREYMNK